jgi:hypothetical protein
MLTRMRGCQTILIGSFAACNSLTLPTEGVEPTRPCGHWILSPARLPIPPRRLTCRDEWLTGFNRNARD